MTVIWNKVLWSWIVFYFNNSWKIKKKKDQRQNAEPPVLCHGSRNFLSVCKYGRTICHCWKLQQLKYFGLQIIMDNKFPSGRLPWVFQFTVCLQCLWHGRAEFVRNLYSTSFTSLGGVLLPGTLQLHGELRILGCCSEHRVWQCFVQKYLLNKLHIAYYYPSLRRK